MWWMWMATGALSAAIVMAIKDAADQGALIGLLADRARAGEARQIGLCLDATIGHQLQDAAVADRDLDPVVAHVVVSCLTR